MLQEAEVSSTGLLPTPGSPSPLDDESQTTVLGISASSPTSGTIIIKPSTDAKSCTVTLSPGGKTSTISPVVIPYSTFSFTGLGAGTTYTSIVTCTLDDGSTAISEPGMLVTPSNTNVPLINVSVDVLSSNSQAGMTVAAPSAALAPVKYLIAFTPVDGGATITIEVTKEQLQSTAVTGLTPGKKYKVVATGIFADGTKTKPTESSTTISPTESTTTIASSKSAATISPS